MEQERRGVRFLFIAAAEIAPENSPSASVATRVTELSLYGCYVETPAPFDQRISVLVKIFNSAEYFEAKATVIYVKPTLGMGLAFRDVRPDYRGILQKWILGAMHSQNNPQDGHR